MSTERGFGARVWWIVLVLSCLFLAWTAFTITNGSSVLEQGLARFAGSTFDLAELDEAGHGFLVMSMIKPLWEELWISVLGVLFAVGLRQMRRYAWTLSVVWGVMILANGVVQGLYEVAILGWSSPCPQTYIFLVIGVIAIGSLLLARKAYFRPHAEGS